MIPSHFIRLNKICTFLPGASEEVARNMLEACNNELDMAIGMYLDSGLAEDGGGGGGGGGSGSGRGRNGGGGRAGGSGSSSSNSSPKRNGGGRKRSKTKVSLRTFMEL